MSILGGIAMFKSIHKYFLLVFIIVFIGVKPFIVSIPSPVWSERVYQDITAAYVQLKDNHPGYHDTKNPQWKDILESEYEQHLSKTSQIASYDEYKALMKSFVRSMNDVHMGVQFVDPEMTIAPSSSQKASIAEFLPQGAWVRLPSFSFNTPEEVSAMQEVIKSMPTYKNHRVIVFDVRGNGGGSSEWGLNFLKALFSTSYVDQQMALVAQKYPEVIEWRASSANITYLKSLLTPENIRVLNLEAFVEALQAIVEGCALALANNELYFKEVPEAQTHITEDDAVNPVTAKIILLTDGACVSSCLDFADTLFAIAPVMHVGHATNADTAYMECRSVSLPSNKASLTFPIKVYRNRIRKPYQKYYPEHVYAGDINDTQALQNWVIGLI